jgi:hypothetical protein
VKKLLRFLLILGQGRRPIVHGEQNGQTPNVKNGASPRTKRGVVNEEIELYCAAYPSGPSAVRRPRVTKQGGLWVAILGPNVTHGIVGFGGTVDAALRAFDRQYLNYLRPL